MKSNTNNASRPGPLIAPVVLHGGGTQKRRKTNGVEKGGARHPVKTKGFKKVLGLKVSGQGKLEFKSDLPKMLIKQQIS